MHASTHRAPPRPSHIAYIRPYAKDGHRRIWIEGRRVSDSGFAPGGRYAVRYDVAARFVELTVTDAIGKKVHRKTKNGGDWPIIDLFNGTLDSVIGDCSRLRVEFHPGRIRITTAPLRAAAARRAEQLTRTLAANQPLRMGSLFHGLGVLDYAVHSGIEDGGIATELRFAVEREVQYLDASLAANPVWTANALALLGDIQDIDLADLPKVDALCAGIPCQGASDQGRTALGLKAPEMHPEVGHLFLPFLRIVEAVQPSVVLIENVPKYESTLSFEMIRRTFANLGYEMETLELCGNDFGALEDRRRLVAVARVPEMPPVLACIDAFKAPVAHAIADVLDPVPADAPEWKPYQGVHDKLARDALKPGNGFKLNLLAAEDRKVPTLIKGYSTTKAWQPFLRHPTDAGLMRKFTAVEHARIKGIPEALIRGLPPTVAHETLGQSVIFPVFRAVGQAIARSLRIMRDGVRVRVPVQQELFAFA